MRGLRHLQQGCAKQDGAVWARPGRGTWEGDLRRGTWDGDLGGEPLHDEDCRVSCRGGALQCARPHGPLRSSLEFKLILTRSLRAFPTHALCLSDRCSCGRQWSC